MKKENCLNGGLFIAYVLFSCIVLLLLCVFLCKGKRTINKKCIVQWKHYTFQKFQKISSSDKEVLAASKRSCSVTGVLAKLAMW